MKSFYRFLVFLVFSTSGAFAAVGWESCDSDQWLVAATCNNSLNNIMMGNTMHSCNNYTKDCYNICTSSGCSGQVHFINVSSCYTGYAPKFGSQRSCVMSSMNGSKATMMLVYSICMLGRDVVWTDCLGATSSSGCVQRNLENCNGVQSTEYACAVGFYATNGIATSINRRLSCTSCADATGNSYATSAVASDSIDDCYVPVGGVVTDNKGSFTCDTQMGWFSEVSQQ